MTDRHTRQTTDRIEPLDFLRGVAISGVMVFHLSAFFGPPGTLLKLVSSQGFFGVQLFFMVSAITMCENWKSRSRESNPTLKFYIRRVARIAGPFWIAIIFYRALDGLGPSNCAPDGISLRQIVSTALFVHALWPDTINCVVPGGWSIGVEMLFYLFFPVLVELKGRPRLYLLIGFAVYLLNVIVVRPTSEVALGDSKLVAEFLYYQIFNQGPIFLVGMALYRVLQGDKFDAPCVALAVIWILTSFVLKFALHVNGSPYFWLPVFCAAAICYVVLKFGISIKPFALLGRVSYSAYLSHFAIIELARMLFERADLNPTTYGSFASALILVVAVTWAVSIVMQYCIEKPSSNLGKKVIHSMLAPSSVGRPAS